MRCFLDLVFFFFFAIIAFEKATLYLAKEICLRQGLSEKRQVQDLNTV